MKIFAVFLYVSISAVVCVNHYDDIDANYILRPDLMPGSLLMLDGVSEYKNTSRNEPPRKKQERLSSNGSWYDAYSTMGFHRKMLNEYLCRNFLADEILSQMQKPLISHRVGRPFSKLNEDKSSKRKSRAEMVDVKDNLLSDPGSSSYRDWLSKTATLEDVYKHYDMAVSRGSEESIEEEYDGGEFTGYAMPGPANAAGKNDYGHHVDDGGSYPVYGPPAYVPQPIQHGEPDKFRGGYEYGPHHVHFHDNDSEKSTHHGLALNDIFDIVLTALAFLAFGMFILQVIMCITSSKETIPMMQMTNTDGGDGDADQVDEVRFKRDASPSSGTSMNELARRVLMSINAGIAAQKDEGACLRRSLCENNKFSRGLVDNQKIWIPVWGLGMSWLSSRLIQGPPSTSAMLDSLRACALGLGRADCTTLYSDCDMRNLLASRQTTKPTG